ncbi:ATP-dependent carboxylate-amine ligase [Natrarchaeobius halalkaliphilus]|uniref:ATP-dependent carboxylate-amine ligase n=1 Tax=Natrarchaeobius halalkaliphilus TaxID=1679091 RepID=A0A3N6LPE1_9EURY|nr:ATP-dependent carboxylate-amine ligase [Natrarchaeobius halalkaliphilus]RQG91323.1 ATP-dependent carboxylate-amine ligase [Natrarchaeobius halalkaliphilus]
MDSDRPTALVLDGDYDTSLVIARELTEDLEATIVGIGTTRQSRLLRSTYCDYAAVVPPPEESTYADALLAVITESRPDIVLPVGYESASSLDAIRSDVPAGVSVCLPPSESFRTAADKRATLETGHKLGIDTPTEYTALVSDLDADGRPSVSDRLPFPVFLKARTENGAATTAPVDDAADFWSTYDRIRASAPENEVLIQEYVDGSRSTYGCGVLCFDNDVELVCTHEELRSVPRHGGSGTHLQLLDEPRFERDAIRLLRKIGWHGIALVEFKRRSDGTFVLMEINPKFWASYALASRFGYRFASTIVAEHLGLEARSLTETPETSGEMVFPLRELKYHLENLDEASLSKYVKTVFGPDAAWDVDPRDLGAWLTPPPDVAQKVTSRRSSENGIGTTATQNSNGESQSKSSSRGETYG